MTDDWDEFVNAIGSAMLNAGIDELKERSSESDSMEVAAMFQATMKISVHLITEGADIPKNEAQAIFNSAASDYFSYLGDVKYDG